MPQQTGVAIPGVQTPALPKLGMAPDFTNNQEWFNTPSGQPLTMAGLRGKVVLVDFWTYTCINCIRTLPFLKGLYAHYHKDGLEIVGVETPEFTFEQEASNVQQAISSDGLRYPVVQDNRYGTWNAYKYKEDEAAVRELLYQAGAHNLPSPMTATAIIPSKNLGTGETYLNPQRAQGFAQQLQGGTHFYPGVTDPIVNEFGLHGTWNATSQSVTPTMTGASITARVQAAHVYLVMTSNDDKARTAKVLVDGKPISASEAGSDVHDGLVKVQGQRLYSLISLPGDQQQTFTIQIPPGISAYDFTFG
jgi:thiol-disulfide isomerase/thioredoxin